MAKPNFKNRTLYHGDNLDFLRGMNSESVHLIATDPLRNHPAYARNRHAPHRTLRLTLSGQPDILIGIHTCSPPTSANAGFPPG